PDAAERETVPPLDEPAQGVAHLDVPDERLAVVRALLGRDDERALGLANQLDALDRGREHAGRGNAALEDVHERVARARVAEEKGRRQELAEPALAHAHVDLRHARAR